MHEPEKTLAQFSLTEREQAAILALPRARLGKWQRELREKRRRVTERVMRMPNTIVVLSFYKDGPAVVWGISPYIKWETITPGMYWLLHTLGKSALPLTVSNLIQAEQTSHSWSLRDMFRVGTFMYTHACTGKKILII